MVISYSRCHNKCPTCRGPTLPPFTSAHRIHVGTFGAQTSVQQSRAIAGEHARSMRADLTHGVRLHIHEELPSSAQPMDARSRRTVRSGIFTSSPGPNPSACSAKRSVRFDTAIACLNLQWNLQRYFKFLDVWTNARNPTGSDGIGNAFDSLISPITGALQWYQWVYFSCVFPNELMVGLVFRNKASS